MFKSIQSLEFNLQTVPSYEENLKGFTATHKHLQKRVQVEEKIFSGTVSGGKAFDTLALRPVEECM